MKHSLWTDPNDDVKILEATKEAANQYGHRHGSELIRLKPEHIEALQSGKMLAWNDEEYSTFVIAEAV